jgi:hypothetical protein
MPIPLFSPYFHDFRGTYYLQVLLCGPVHPFSLTRTPPLQMATTRNQYLHDSLYQAQESINHVTSKIGSTNSRLAQFETQVQHKFDTMEAKFMTQFNTLHYVVNQLLNCTLVPSSSTQPYVVDSSHSLPFQSNSFHRDPCLPRIEVDKFDGSDPTSWVTQMEHYFSLHCITDELDKLCYVVLYLDPEQWQWWQWRKNSCKGYITWTYFVAELYDRFDIDTHYLSRLTKLKQSSTVEDFITTFENFSFRTEGMLDALFHEYFISGLKDEIRSQVLMAHPQTWLEATKCSKEAQQVIFSQNKKPSFVPHPRPTNPNHPATPLKV